MVNCSNLFNLDINICKWQGFFVDSPSQLHESQRTKPSVKRMVMSLLSHKYVWNVMNNEAVLELRKVTDANSAPTHAHNKDNHTISQPRVSRTSQSNASYDFFSRKVFVSFSLYFFQNVLLTFGVRSSKCSYTDQSFIFFLLR